MLLRKIGKIGGFVINIIGYHVIIRLDNFGILILFESFMDIVSVGLV